MKKQIKKVMDKQLKDVVSDASNILSKGIDGGIDIIKKYKFPLILVVIGYLIWRYFFKEEDY